MEASSEELIKAAELVSQLNDFAEKYDDSLENVLVWNNVQISPAVLAQLLKHSLVFDNELMTLRVKTFWLEVADELGPNWLSALRKATGFMAKSNEF